MLGPLHTSKSCIGSDQGLSQCRRVSPPEGDAPNGGGRCSRKDRHSDGDKGAPYVSEKDGTRAYYKKPSTDNTPKERQRLYVLTFNLKIGLKDDSTKDLLMNQLKNFKYDIIGLCETRASTEYRVKWKENGDEIIVGAGEGKHHIGGVGFIINSKIADKVIEVNIHSSRIATLKLEVGKKKPLLIVQIYAPHAGYDPEDIEQFYSEVETQLQQPACDKIIIGDFNAQLGSKHSTQRCIGKHTDDKWTMTGEMMADFAERNKLFIMNSFFEKPKEKRWTYQSTNAAKTRHELDYGLSTDRLLVQNVDVLCRLNVGSDHRPVRLTLNLKIKKGKKRVKRIGRTLNGDILKNDIENTNWNIEGTLTEKFETFCSKLKKCMQNAACKKMKESRLSAETCKLLAKRACMNRCERKNIIEFVELSKLIRRKMQEDFDNFKMRKLLEAAENRRSLKKCRKELQQQTATMVALKDADGNRLVKRIDMERRVKEYYTTLFDSKKNVRLGELEENDEDIPNVLISEVREAIKSLKNDKAPGPDGITNEVLKAGEFTLWKVLAKLFDECIEQEDVPTQWKSSTTVIIPKKGDREDLKNYRPIALLPTVYKVFTKVLLNRMSRQLDEGQPREQAGFRSGYSTLDHLQSINQVLERCRECQIPLCIVFVDYEKAFDSIEINAVINALAKQGIHQKYLKTLLNTNRGCSTQIRLFYKDLNIPIRRGVRQGDTISPKLFTAALEDVFRQLDWDKCGISIDGEKLSHLRFADDIVLFAKDVNTAEKMLSELNEASTAVGLRINRAKTQAMKNNYCGEAKMTLENTEITFTDKYVYLGQQITADHKIDGEIRRRRSAAWNSFNNIREVLKKTTDVKIRAQLFNSTVLPALNYGSETWTMRESEKQKLTATQRAMERRIIGVRIVDKIRSNEIRKKTLFKDAYDDAIQRKLRWAGHVARRKDNRWTTRTTFWWPYDYKRPLGRPPERWRKLMKERIGPTWRQIAENREEYRRRLYDPPRCDGNV